MSEEMIELYKKLSNNEKRNELSSLLTKTDKLLDELLKIGHIQINTQTKNYDKNENMKEEDMLLFFYEDLWNIKNKILTLLVLKDR